MASLQKQSESGVLEKECCCGNSGSKCSSAEPVRPSSLSDEQIAAELRNLLGKDQVLTRLIERQAHAGDASIYRLVPRLVVMPEKEEDVRKLLAYCRDRELHLTFRAAGTSLSGQAVTDGILVSILRKWKDYQILDEGRVVVSQPGVVGEKLNQALLPYGYKIGPDPASINAAMMGGIAANNASGLCCGITQNTYQTLRNIRVMLEDGFTLDTADPDAEEKLRRSKPQLVEGLLQLRQEILSEPQLAERIRHKYLIKNTTGYGINALVDYENPVDILAHLMIGSEGTLGFISEITLNTVRLAQHWATALIFFKDLVDSGEAIFRLREMGAVVVEFMDKASMKSVSDKMNYGFEMTRNCAALLVEFQEESESALAGQLAAVSNVIDRRTLLEPYEFTRDSALRNRFWGMRKGLYPSVGAMRQRGTAVIIEDVVFPVRRMPEAIPRLQDLMIRSGFPDGIIFGHAKEGNLHPVVTQDFASREMVDRYAKFMDELADLVINQYDGSFKGEHGTGRNVAPFVELEWGKQAYNIMVRIKELFDPRGILNPGVLINPDPKAHLKDLKPMPVFSEVADPCIECGFCEVRCPSRDLTLTPRQRIAVRRQIALLSQSRDASEKEQARILEKEYGYFGVDTCAVDSMCAEACPVKIDTGSIAKAMREEQSPGWQRSLALFAARHYGLGMAAARLGLRLAKLVERLLGRGVITVGSKVFSWLSLGTAPALAPEIPLPNAAPPLPKPVSGRHSRTVVYFPSCLTRSMGRIAGEQGERELAECVLFVLDRLGWNVVYPEKIAGLCCGQPFSSKGFPSATKMKTKEVIQALWDISEGGKLPVICDTSPCTGQLMRAGEYLQEPELSQWKKIQILDLTTFLARKALPDAKNLKQLPVHAVLHPTCTIIKIGADRDLIAVAKQCAERVTVPVMAECCGFAGDRGFLHPELTLSATTQESKEVRALSGEKERHIYLSTCRTCELGMSAGTGLSYQSIIYLVAEALDAGAK